MSLSERSALVREAGRSDGAEGSLARHSHDGVEARKELPKREEKAASARWPGDKEVFAWSSPQQPQPGIGRAAQQARGVWTGLAEQAEATSENENIPRIAERATMKTFILGRRVDMACSL